MLLRGKPERPYTPIGRSARHKRLRYRFWRLWFRLRRTRKVTIPADGTYRVTYGKRNDD